MTDSGSCRVLIVDDEPITRMDLSDMLTEQNYTVVGEASDGFDAVELCREKHPDVVLMDVKMPVFDGLTASETILSEDLAKCVVLLTAFNDSEIVERAGKAGVTGYLVKPIDQKSLRPTIEIALAQSLRLRESRNEAREAQNKIREDRLVHKAQLLFAKKEGCSEAEAYRKMRSMAMNKRISLASLAQHIVEQWSKDEAVSYVKKYMMDKKHMSEEKAYHYICDYANAQGMDIEAAAQAIKKQLEKNRC